MGTEKAWLEIDGKPLVVRQAERLGAAFDGVFVSAKEGRRFSAAGLTVIEDAAPEFAALHGIRAALARLGRPIFVLAVDLPEFPVDLAAAIAGELVARPSACAAPVAGGVVQGLCAAYSPAALPTADAMIAAGRFAIRDLVAECGGTLLEESFWGRFAGPAAFSNWNRPDDHRESSRGR